MPFRPLLLLCLICAGAARAAAPDVRSFDVSGVQLGMGMDEATKIVMDKLKLAKTSLRFDPMKREHPVSKKKEPTYFSAEKGPVKLLVHFQASIPFDKQKPMIVSSVRYELPWTPENVQAMKDAALQRYGETSNGTLSPSWHWCQVPDKNPGNGCSEYTGAKLMLHGTTLELLDPTYQQAVIQFERDLQKAKPTF